MPVLSLEPQPLRGLEPMTRKDFELIAATLNRAYLATRGEEQGIVLAIVADFADKLRSTNPQFDAGRFVYACKKAA